MRFALTLAAMAAAVPCAAAPLPHFRATDVFDLTPTSKVVYYLAEVPNASGQFIGRKAFTHQTGEQAFVTGPDGRGRTRLVDPAGWQVLPWGLDDAGRVVGMTQDARQVSTRAFLADTDGRLLDLGTLGGDYGLAEAINAAGLIVGTSTDASGRARAFLAQVSDPTLRDLGLPGYNSNARAVSAAGQITGSYNLDPDGDFHTYLTDPGGAHPRDVMPERVSDPTGINAAGQIVGRATSDKGIEVAFITGPDGASPKLLGADFDASQQSWAMLSSIDDAGRAVGVAYPVDRPGIAVWADVEGGKLVKLETLTTLPDGVHLIEAQIDRTGRIYATGNNHHEYLLTAD